jgi:hypothetical protein
MEVITYIIDTESLKYTYFMGAFQLWVILSFLIFKYNLGKYLF